MAIHGNANNGHDTIVRPSPTRHISSIKIWLAPVLIELEWTIHIARLCDNWSSRSSQVEKIILSFCWQIPSPVSKQFHLLSSHTKLFSCKYYYSNAQFCIISTFTEKLISQNRDRILLRTAVSFDLPILSSETLIYAMVSKEDTIFDEGRGAYDTTGVPKPPPKPK